MQEYSSKIGSQKFILSDVDSTNNFAAKLVKEGIGGHGSVIMAENQSNGRGQQGSIWQSQANLNLLVSVVLCRKELSNMNPIHLNWFVSICIVDFLKDRDIQGDIKWPNDILIGNAKIAGILIENKIVGSKLEQAILGIGINVNQFSFESLNATSMKMLTGLNYSLLELLDEFIFHLKKNESLLYNSEGKELKNRYLSSLFGMEQERTFVKETGVFEGKIVGVDQIGKLLIESKGEVFSFQNKEVQFL